MCLRSPYSLPCTSVACNQRVLTRQPILGDTITFYYWSAAELAISIVSISLPNMTQLFRRAHQHGISALFTRREYAASMGSGSKRGPGGSALAQGGKGGFQRIIGSDDTSFAVNQDPLIPPKDQSASYTVSACAQQPEERELIALDQVHLRQDIDVREEERWPMVWPQVSMDSLTTRSNLPYHGTRSSNLDFGRFWKWLDIDTHNHEREPSLLWIEDFLNLEMHNSKSPQKMPRV